MLLLRKQRQWFQLANRKLNPPMSLFRKIMTVMVVQLSQKIRRVSSRKQTRNQHPKKKKMLISNLSSISRRSLNPVPIGRSQSRLERGVGISRVFFRLCFAVLGLYCVLSVIRLWYMEHY
ncbi:hypothetical protein DPMN_005704 [Dreissena polymorpha]|uniref:Uncharacterized protein n=1 Tax=Dreissena polymorpha TaxID=45954 RepID=A0A9D4RX40_DREPO|nr:hypothetical protein DPMN_005704 [Dreissena polymorpha]